MCKSKNGEYLGWKTSMIMLMHKTINYDYEQRFSRKPESEMFFPPQIYLCGKLMIELHYTATNTLHSSDSM